MGAVGVSCFYSSTNIRNNSTILNLEGTDRANRYRRAPGVIAHILPALFVHAPCFHLLFELCPAPDHPVHAPVSELPMSIGTRPPDSYARGTCGPFRPTFRLTEMSKGHQTQSARQGKGRHIRWQPQLMRYPTRATADLDGRVLETQARLPARPCSRNAPQPRGTVTPRGRFLEPA